MRRGDEGPDEVSQQAQASDRSHVQQAGRDIYNWYHAPAAFVPLPRRGLPRVAAGVWGVLSFVLANGVVVLPYVQGPRSPGSALAGLVLMLVAAPVAWYVSGVVVYLSVRTLLSNRARDGFTRWWVRGLVGKVVVAGLAWWLVGVLLRAV
ncbi:hypothetical protein ACQPZF_38315 [Actinosynnema sp. CS-041913]|uniref:hypothetical protein n=1 Tax=Actinosynnema sp. CS-041913 TaxID=3239917 RepID=UPI003D8DE817